MRVYGRSYFQYKRFKMADLNININGLPLKNPVLTASGTFGYGTEFQDFIDLERLGGFIVKGTTLKHREGNPYPRMAETPSGMLNAVGLQNKGVDYFIEHIYPTIKDINSNILVNVSGSTISDYVATAEKINALDHIPAIELNISCPNVKEGGMAFGTSCVSAAEVVKEVRKVYKKHLMVKLSPNVTSLGCGRSWCRFCITHQHVDGNGCQCKNSKTCIEYSYRRIERSLRETCCTSYGLASCQSRENSSSWFGGNKLRQ